MKKTLILLLVFALCLCLVACTRREPSLSEGEDTTTVVTGSATDDEDTTTTASKTTARPVMTTLTVPALAKNAKTLQAATVKTFKGSITKAKEVDSYTYTPTRDGRYTFELSEVRADVAFRMVLYNRLGEKVIDDGYAVNGDFIYADLKAGETYTCKVAHNANTGDYILSIGEQTATTDITAFSEINDSIVYNQQRNKYTFIPERDGRYTFELTEARAQVAFRVVLYDRLGEKVIDDGYTVNEDFIYADLKAGETYTLVVFHHTNFGSYRLNIGKQKETADITDYSNIRDSIEFKNQRNLYTFTAKSTSHTIKFNELSGSFVLRVQVRDRLDKVIMEDSYCENGDGLVLTGLNVGETYTLAVHFNGGYGDYVIDFK